MNQILSGLAGALILAGLYFTVVFARKIGKGATALTAAMKGIPQLVKSNQEVASALHRFSAELEFLRTAMIGGTPQEGGEGGESPAAPQRPRPVPVQFPGWQPFVAATDVPDAEEGDTVVMEQDDAALAELEQVEEIRNRGYAAGEEADPMSNPPGITANV